ncbi:MAG TPA: Hsp70 family protein [Blastocatellia bacterium]|nr:Hsp70 family protein [Blastocatellia bacterium]
MLLGVDYGTTRTVVAAVDRGNYPVISFHNRDGDTQDWYPSLVAARGGELRFGLDAAACQDEQGWLMLRSFKRELARLGPESAITLGDRSVTALDLLTAFLAQLRRDLRESSNLRISRDERLECMISVPANANSNQRFVTLEAFRRAGFDVRGMMNEPSAAGIEYAHLHLREGASLRREHVVVYDLGGGTFDASVISMAERRHEVLSSEGIAQLGGDDFDRLLLDLALDAAGITDLSGEARYRLLEECREKKEGLHPNTRRVAIDLGRALDGAGEVVVSTAEFYECCRPLVERTIEAVERTAQAASSAGALDWASVAAVYLVGGSSDLPVVARLLRERYARLVRKSPYPHASAAIGLAIAADREAGYQLRERFTRHFGVWREAEDGREVTFDVLFEKDALLPGDGEESLRRSRRYRPAHNVGHFRYLECSRIDGRGQPVGDITPWDEIYFPFDPALSADAQLDRVPITRAQTGDQLVEELYACDARGIIEVSIVNHTTAHRRGYLLHGKPS